MHFLVLLCTFRYTYNTMQHITEPITVAHVLRVNVVLDKWHRMAGGKE